MGEERFNYELGLLRNKLIDITILFIAAFFIPVLVFSFIRMYDEAWSWIHTMHIIIAMVVLILFFFRKKMRAYNKALIVYFLFLAAVSAGMFIYGIAGQWQFYAIIPFLIHVIFMNRKTLALSILYFVLLFIACMWGVSKDLVPLIKVDSEYLSSYVPWLNLFGAFGYGVGISTYLISKHHRFFIDAILRAIDRDEIKELNEELITIQEELRKANTTKDKFFSIIAHDLKSPFNTMLGFSELLLEEFDQISEEQQKYMLQQLRQKAFSAYDLTVNLLMWSRSQNQSLVSKPVVLPLKSVIEKSFDWYEDYELISNVKEGQEVVADYDMFLTILRNLIINGVKFTPNGGSVSIGISELNGEQAKQFNISVCDTGVGISPENMKKLFNLDENFTTKGTQDEKGSGLGLILTKEFVEAHDSELKIKSKEGEGTCFSFHLPAPADV